MFTYLTTALHKNSHKIKINQNNAHVIKILLGLCSFLRSFHPFFFKYVNIYRKENILKIKNA